MSYQQSSLGGTSQGLEPFQCILVQTVIDCSLRPDLQQLAYINNVGNRQEQITKIYRCMITQL